MESAAPRLRRKSKGLKQALIRRIGDDYRESLAATYHCAPRRSRTSQADTDLLRLKSLLERREQLLFQRTSVDLTLTIARKARTLLRQPGKCLGNARIAGLGQVQRAQTLDRTEEETKRLNPGYKIEKNSRKRADLRRFQF